jgi:hypothetical protein
MTDFWKGFLCGLGCSLAIAAFAGVSRFFYKRDLKIIETMEAEIETQKMLEDYSRRDAADFLDGSPAVRGAADKWIDNFDRKRDEILQRARSGKTD